MSNSATVVTNLSSFEEQLKSIIASKEEVVRQMRETDEAIFQRYGTKTEEQILLHKHSMQEPKTLRTGINVYTSSNLTGTDFHKQIRELIESKAYPVEETDWFNYNGTNRWYFGFTY